MSKETLVIIRESIWQGVVNTALSLVSVALIIGLGVWLESDAMQWIGFFMVFIVMFGRAAAYKKQKTPQEAADWLLEEYDVIAKSISTTKGE